MKPGIKGLKERKVTQEITADAIGSGTLKVLATPAMIALMEATAMESVIPCLDEGQGTVGIKIDIQHTAPTAVGMTVSCASELTEIDGRRLVFDVEVRDEKELVGKGKHERFIIDEEEFFAKAQAKLKKE